MSTNIYFNSLSKCYYEYRKATLEHVKKYPKLKIGDDIGERIYMVFDKYNLNAFEYLTTDRINHKFSNNKDLEIIELIKKTLLLVLENYINLIQYILIYLYQIQDFKKDKKEVNIFQKYKIQIGLVKRMNNNI